jgi:hypothetical protein
MNLKGIATFVLAAWGIPIISVAVVVFSLPHATARTNDFPSIRLTPASISSVRKEQLDGSNYFELWIRDANGSSYFVRDPEPEPIEELTSQIPEGVELSLVYRTAWEGNELLEIATSGPAKTRFLSFDETMKKYTRRRLVVYLIAAIWFACGTIIFVLWLKTPTDADLVTSPAGKTF